MIETPIDTIEIQSPPSITPETAVCDAARHLRRPDVSALPVLEDEAIVGIVTESDIVAMVAETDAQPVVRELMSTPVTTIAATATIVEAAETMRANGIKQLPVLTDGTYYGICSVGSLAPYLSRRALDIEWQAEPLSLDTAERGNGNVSASN